MRVTEEWLAARLAKSDNLKAVTDIEQPCDNAKAAKRKPPKMLKLTPYEPPESDILPDVLKALELHPAVAKVWRVNSGAGRLQYPDGSLSRFLRFGFTGCPDILGFTRNGGKLIAVEVKRPREKPDKNQQAFLDAVNSAGGIAFCARDGSDVFRELGKAA